MWCGQGCSIAAAKRKLRKRVAFLGVCSAAVVVLVVAMSEIYVLTQPDPAPAQFFTLEWPGASVEQGSPSDLPPLYIITPTYRRPEQIPELTRLGQTLMHVPKLHWLVADDTTTVNQLVVDYLKHTGIPFTYLLSCAEDAVPATTPGRHLPLV